MKLFSSLLLLVLFVSCIGDDSIKNNNQTEADIIQYIEDNNLEATRSDLGVFYIIEEQGEGVKPDSDYYATVSYKGYLLDGSVFDKTEEEGTEIDLQKVITGFTDGLSFFNEGGKGTIIIPPNLAFGDFGVESIPGGSVLIFEIELKKVTGKETEDDILKYLETNNIETQRSESGLYYEIENLGEGEPITISSIVTIKYKGYFLDGTEFDASGTNGVQFDLQNLIPGFSEGITYFKKGGKGRLFIPPSIGYGEKGYYPNIRRSAVLIFDIEVL